MKKEKKKSKHMKTINKKKVLYNVILFIMICIFLYSGYNIILWLKSNKETKELEEGLYSEVVLENKEEEKEEETTQIDFKKLKEINSDIIAWIKIENTYINYPILQGETDEYYLRKDIYKKYSLSGSIFVDATTKSDFSDDNTIIYGHNMKNERMFSDLHKIHNEELGKNVSIQIFTPKEKREYKVISSYIAIPNLDIIQKKFSEKQKQKYIEQAINKSSVKYETEIDNTKKIITLITCDENRSKRVIINAIEVIL